MRPSAGDSWASPRRSRDAWTSLRRLGDAQTSPPSQRRLSRPGGGGGTAKGRLHGVPKSLKRPGRGDGTKKGGDASPWNTGPN